MRQLEGRVAVVTGAAHGIGRALAAGCATAGMKVVLADRDTDGLVAVAHSGEFADREFLSVTTDVTDPGSVRALADRVVETFGAAHLLCNNAGILGRCGDTWATPVDEWRRVFDVNLWGVVNGLNEFVPILLDQDEGHIVNTASAAAWLSGPGLGPYAASKHALLALSESLRLELEGLKADIGVSVLCPQFVNTEIANAAGDRADHADDSRGGRLRAAIVRGIRSGVAPEVIAHVVLDGVRDNRFLITEAPEAIVANAERRVEIASGGPPRTGR